jgi:hypothetical protein
VPAGGLWAGVKYEMPSAGLTETSGQVILEVFTNEYYNYYGIEHTLRGDWVQFMDLIYSGDVKT